jgi:hypothetical protein
MVVEDQTLQYILLGTIVTIQSNPLLRLVVRKICTATLAALDKVENQ